MDDSFLMDFGDIFNEAIIAGDSEFVYSSNRTFSG